MPPEPSLSDVPDHHRPAGQDKIGLLTPQTKAAVAVPVVQAPAQPPLQYRIAIAIRAHWTRKYAQDWGQAPCEEIAKSVTGALIEAPTTALEAAGISTEQWAKFVAAVGEGK